MHIVVTEVSLRFLKVGARDTAGIGVYGRSWPNTALQGTLRDKAAQRP